MTTGEFADLVEKMRNAQKAFTKGFDLGVKFASNNGTPIIKTIDKIISS